MRLGCLGCLVLSVLLLALGILIGGGLVFYTSVFTLPEPLPAPAWTVSDGYRAQQKMLELVLRETGESSRTEPLALTEKEVNAFLARHLKESAALPLSPLLVKFHPGVVVIEGKTELKPLLRGFPFNYLTRLLPASQADQPVWVVIQGTVRVDRGQVRKFLHVDPVGFRVGTLETGTWFVSWVLGSDLLSWPVPRVIDRISLEEGRAVVVTEKR